MSSLPFSGAVDLAALATARAAEQAASKPGGAVELTEAGFQAILQESMRRPVFVLLCSPAAPQCGELTTRVKAVLARVAPGAVLATVNVDLEVGIAQAFQVQAVPAMLALLGGRPIPLFQGSPEDDQLADVFEQVIAAASQAGVGGAAAAGDAASGEEGEEAAQAPLPPLHQEAFDAIERGDLESAVAAYDKALKENPRDADAKAGRAQVSLLMRLAVVEDEAIVSAAKSGPEDVAGNLIAADAEVMAGRPDLAFARLIGLIKAVPGEQREPVRLRLVELFDVIGIADPTVVAARKELAAALF